MAFIESIEEIEDGPQRNMRSVFAHRPAVLTAWRQLLGAITADMDERLYELVTLAAAGSLRSSYCALAHGQVLLERHVSEAELLALALDPASAPVTPVESAAMGFARKVVQCVSLAVGRRKPKLRRRRIESDLGGCRRHLASPSRVLPRAGPHHPGPPACRR